MKKRLKFTTYLAILNLILISDLKGDINAVFRGRGVVMEEELRYFVAYLENIRKASHNTVMSYHSDLTKMIAYLHGQGMDSVSAVRYHASEFLMCYFWKRMEWQQLPFPDILLDERVL